MNMNAPMPALRPQDYVTPPPLPVRQELPSTSRGFRQISQPQVQSEVGNIDLAENFRRVRAFKARRLEQERIEQLKAEVIDDTWQAIIPLLSSSVIGISELLSKVNEYDHGTGGVYELEKTYTNLNTAFNKLITKYDDQGAESIGWWRKMQLGLLLGKTRDIIPASNKALHAHWDELEKICNS